MCPEDKVVESLTKVFENTTVVDRRNQPSHGYRAVHIVVKEGGKLVEIQVRTVSDKTAVKEIARELQDALDDLQRKLMNNRENLARVLQKAIDLAAKQNWRKP